MGAQGRHDGLTLRVTDALLGQALEGWETLNGRAQAKTAEAPDLARLFTGVDEHQRRYTDPAPGQVFLGSASTGGPSIRQVAGSAQMVCPIGGPLEHRSDFGDPRSGGRSHQGNDLFAEHGTPVVAPFDGVVIDVANDEGTAGLGGLALWLRAEGGALAGWEAYLAHNARNVAVVGQKVKAGQVVAYVGDTGNASADAPHVHFQLHPGGGPPVDPWSYTSAACAANRKDVT
jgi:murein DD-endopeptidase MepM/ murein hydrolase activator NlpD